MDELEELDCPLAVSANPFPYNIKQTFISTTVREIGIVLIKKFTRSCTERLARAFRTAFRIAGLTFFKLRHTLLLA